MHELGDTLAFIGGVIKRGKETRESLRFPPILILKVGWKGNDQKSWKQKM